MKLILALALLVTMSAQADDHRDKRLVDIGIKTEYAMLSDSGSIVLTEDPCTEKNEFGFDKVAYATEKKPDGTSILHQGCWTIDKDATVISIWFYNESPGLVASYSTKYFTKREVTSI